MTKRIMWQQKDMNIIPIHTGRHVMSAIQCLTKQNTAGTAVRSTTPATTEKEGVKTYTCTVCKATKTEAVPKVAKPTTPTKQSISKAQITGSAARPIMEKHRPSQAESDL